jgi:hypothetical protein
VALSCTTLKIRPFRVNQSAITLNGDGQCRAEPWNRTTPYELEARHALFTLVPLMPRLFAGVFRQIRRLSSDFRTLYHLSETLCVIQSAAGIEVTLLVGSSSVCLCEVRNQLLNLILEF